MRKHIGKGHSYKCPAFNDGKCALIQHKSCVDRIGQFKLGESPCCDNCDKLVNSENQDYIQTHHGCCGGCLGMSYARANDWDRAVMNVFSSRAKDPKHNNRI